jgi:class 3 adenylate cyclase
LKILPEVFKDDGENEKGEKLLTITDGALKYASAFVADLIQRHPVWLPSQRYDLYLRNDMDAERRQVTVLFTDMVGFTTFSERSGEEAAYTLMRDLSKLMGDCVREQGGTVQTFTGDGIMAVFGAPIAFEDAPL